MIQSLKKSFILILYLGTLDFLGINHYFSVNATKLQIVQEQPLKCLDSNFELSLIEELPYSNPMWLSVSDKNI